MVHSWPPPCSPASPPPPPLRFLTHPNPLTPAPFHCTSSSLPRLCLSPFTTTALYDDYVSPPPPFVTLDHWGCGWIWFPRTILWSCTQKRLRLWYFSLTFPMLILISLPAKCQSKTPFSSIAVVVIFVHWSRICARTLKLESVHLLFQFGSSARWDYSVALSNDQSILGEYNLFEMNVHVAAVE